jgi:chemotaxis response regulator CheB
MDTRPDTAARAAAMDVVALVASAGGVEALTTLLTSLPTDLPAAVVVQQHLGSPGSRLVEILRRSSGYVVEWAVDGGGLVPGAALVTPARRRMEIRPDGTCALGSTEVDARERPHDSLLASLADSYGPRALAVVLTGMGHDGAEGVRAVKAAGGTVIAQSEESAVQPSMPRAAIRAGADLVVPLPEIAAVISDVVRGGAVPVAAAEEA